MAEKITRKKAGSFFTSPYWPALLSGLIAPGLGQISNREFPKGLLLLGVTFTAYHWFFRVLNQQLQVLLPGSPDNWMSQEPQLKAALEHLFSQSPGFFLTFFFLMTLAWGFSVVDAYLTARDRKKGKKTKKEAEE